MMRRNVKGGGPEQVLVVITASGQRREGLALATQPNGDDRQQEDQSQDGRDEDQKEAHACSLSGCGFGVPVVL
jgi:hypothetical protein